jgi:hypothetical protein
MKSKLIAIILFTFLTTSFFAQKKQSLIVVEYDDNVAVNHMQNIVNYSFIDGAMIGKEVLLSVPTQKPNEKGNYIRFDIGTNKIYRNRYIVTGIGNIIDIKNKKILLAEKDEFVAFNGDSIIFHTNDIFKGQYYSIFNLKTEKYQKVANANYNPLPRPSVEVDETKKPFSISAYAVNGKQTVLVQDAGYPQPTSGETVKRRTNIFWLDNNSFLYANFSNNQHALSIYKVGIDKSVEKIADMDAVPTVSANALFQYDAAKNIIYSCGKGRFLVDVKNKKVEPVLYENVGNNFYVESKENEKYGRAIKFETTEIGKKWCRFDNAQTVKNYAAFQIEMVIGTEHYPQGVAVWHAPIKKWTSLDISSVANIVGWIEE